MDDLIKRQAAIDAVTKAVPTTLYDIIRVLEDLTTIEPKPSRDWNGWENGCGRTYNVQPKKGKWIAVFIEYTDGTTGSRCECPFCKEQQLTWTNYCPNCGAQMERSEDETG